jgi:hypothetical protein
MTDEDLDALAQAALTADFDPVPWDEAPDWRRIPARRIAEAAVASSGLSAAEHARSAWTLAMTTLGWYWGREIDEKAKRHPGIVYGELTRGGVAHWTGVVEAVRAVARQRGVRLTGE